MNSERHASRITHHEYMIKRKLTKTINVGGVNIGGLAPVSVQSMTKTAPWDVKKTVEQIKSLENMGCHIVRLAIPDEKAVEAFAEIKKKVGIPLVADIHFDYRLATGAIRAGADCIRINPGNIGGREKIRLVVNEAKAREIPIRIGINSGSIEKDLLEKYGHPTSEAMVDSVLRHIEIMEDLNFYSLKLSLKSSNVMDTVEAYRIISSKTDYPLHLGITEAGSSLAGIVKSSIGLGILLSEGTGDTIRVSLTAPPEEEVLAGYEILRTLGLREKAIEIVSCPTCGRCEVKLFDLVKEIKEKTNHINKPFVVAIMGCVVNGPGEAKEADLGIACGKGAGVIFRKGEIYKKVKEDDMAAVLLEEIFKETGSV